MLNSINYLFVWADSYRDALHDREEEMEEYASNHNGNYPSFNFAFFCKVWLILFIVTFLLYFFFFLIFDRDKSNKQSENKHWHNLLQTLYISFVAGFFSIILPTTFAITIMWFIRIIFLFDKKHKNKS